ncbi:MAG TPA: SRPBCC domain-containing protein [Candidatus Acidoferrales bacterium]|nr:SRPBCC domain-containing protein [Candidatus Acidoferrales bacterium]
MNSNLFSRREISARLASLFPAIGLAGAALRFSGASHQSTAGAREEVSHTAEAIHQEVFFKVSRKRVYEALTDAGQFTKVTRFSTVKNAPPAEISRDVGGAFKCFGGVISGRHVELTPNERVVQAWRDADWDAGVYSIAKFELQEQGDGTKIIFDHTGFPSGEGNDLAAGWKANYWEPLTKYFET